MGLRSSRNNKRVVGMIVVMLGLAAVSACTDDPAPSDRSSAFRCRAALPNGSCYSTPADCPVTLPHSDEPHCPVGATLISVAEDDCAQKLICID